MAGPSCSDACMAPEPSDTRTVRVGWGTSFREGFRAWPYVWRRSLLVAACSGFLASLARVLGWVTILDELSLGVIAFVATQGLIAVLFFLLLALRAMSSRS